MPKSKSRFIISVVISILIVVFLFNFSSRDIAILASRSLGRQILDYLLNFVIFFAVIYLLLTLFALIKKKIFPHSK